MLCRGTAHEIVQCDDAKLNRKNGSPATCNGRVPYCTVPLPVCKGEICKIRILSAEGSSWFVAILVSEWRVFIGEEVVSCSAIAGPAERSRHSDH